MNLAIYDTSLDGHRASYIKAIAMESSNRGWQTSILLPASARGHEATTAIRETVGERNVHFSPLPEPHFGSGTLALARYHLNQRNRAQRCIESLRPSPDFVYIPSLDVMDKAIQLLGSPAGKIPMGGMCMRTRFHMRSEGIDAQTPSRVSIIGSLPFRRLLRVGGVECVTTADPSLADYAKRQKPKEFQKVKFVPEIGMDKPNISARDARQMFGLDGGDRVILAYGVITERKSLPELVDAIQSLPDSRIRILIAGQPDNPSRQFLASAAVNELVRRRRIILKLGYSSPEVESAAFSAADAVWVAYKNHSTMSGVLLQAVCCEIPVITANYGLAHWLTSREGIGVSVDLTKPDIVAQQIQSLLLDGDKYKSYQENARRIADRHRPKRFGEAVCDAIQESHNDASRRGAVQSTAQTFTNT